VNTVSRKTAEDSANSHSVETGEVQEHIEKMEDLADAIDKALKVFGGSLGQRQLSVTEFIRLFEFRQEMQKKAPKDILVHWQETWEDPANDQ
jgi:hypothetical protein